MNTLKSIQRELALVRVRADGELQNAALEVVGAWSGRLLQLTPEEFTVEISADPTRVNSFLAALAPYGMIVSFRSGVVSMT